MFSNLKVLIKNPVDDQSSWLYNAKLDMEKTKSKPEILHSYSVPDLKTKFPLFQKIITLQRVKLNSIYQYFIFSTG